MRAALYARTSTIDKQDPEMQLSALRDFCKAREWEIIGEFVDKDSGIKERRRALDNLMDHARKRKIDFILVWKLDRWGRSLKHLINSLFELQNLGVAFVSYSENIDLSTPTGKLMFHVIGAMAEFERELIRERVKQGLENAKAKGRKVGRRSQITEELLKTVGNMRTKGSSLREISKALGISKSLVHKTLKISSAQSPENTGSGETENGVHN